MGTKFVNQDGLTIRFGTRVQGDDRDVPSQTSTGGLVQQLTFRVDLADINATDAASGSDGEFVNSALIPANATVQAVSVITEIVAASTGAADVILGHYTLSAGVLVLVDADSLLDAGSSALADFSAVGETMVIDKATGGAALGKTTLGSSPTVLACASLTEVYTAGRLKFIVDYVLQDG